MRGRAKAAAAKARIRKSAEERIKAAAIVAFANKGAHGTTIAEIAGSLNMPTATVHYYFKSKKDLYDAVLQQIVRLWFSKIADIEDGSDPLAEIEKYHQHRTRRLPLIAEIGGSQRLRRRTPGAHIFQE